MVWAAAGTTRFQGKCPQSADKPDSAIANAPSLTYILHQMIRISGFFKLNLCATRQKTFQKNLSL